ncbi:hypothetical protein PSY31_24040, partial [Shigella flexneri]|nr:hypothetical protein [Shigella flexneri]
FPHANPTYKSLLGKPWPFYNNWCEVFGKHRAQGSVCGDFDSAKEDIDKLLDEYGEEEEEGKGDTTGEEEHTFVGGIA